MLVILTVPKSQYFNLLKVHGWLMIRCLADNLMCVTQRFFLLCLRFPVSFGVSLKSSIGSGAFSSLTTNINFIVENMKDGRRHLGPRSAQRVDSFTCFLGMSSVLVKFTLVYTLQNPNCTSANKWGSFFIHTHQIQTRQMTRRSQHPSVFPLHHPYYVSFFVMLPNSVTVLGIGVLY